MKLVSIHVMDDYTMAIFREATLEDFNTCAEAVRGSYEETEVRKNEVYGEYELRVKGTNNLLAKYESYLDDLTIYSN